MPSLGKSVSPLKTVHVWLGLTVGILAAIVSLTGSLLTFSPSIDVALNPEMAVAAGTRVKSLESVYQVLRPQAVDNNSEWNIEIPADGGVVTAEYLAAPTEEFSGTTQRRLVSLDPEQFNIVRDVRWGRTPMTWAYEVHQRLFMGTTGVIVVGVVGLVFIAMIVTGIAVWWPSGPGQRFAVFSDTSAQGWLYDMHKLIGAVSAVPLLLVVATGVLLSLDQGAGPFVSGPHRLSPDPRSVMPSDARRIPVDRAVEAAMKRFPGARAVRVRVPQRLDGTYLVNLRQDHEVSPRFPHTYVWVDQYRGSVLAVHDPAQAGFITRCWNLLHSLHNGDLFSGIGGRYVLLVIGLMPLLLFITGLTRWLLRRYGAFIAG